MNLSLVLIELDMIVEPERDRALATFIALMRMAGGVPNPPGAKRGRPREQPR